MSFPQPRDLANAKGGIDVEAWTEQALSALRSVHLAAQPSRAPRPFPTARGTSVTLEIPLDVDASDADAARAATINRPGMVASQPRAEAPTRRKELMRRDSLKRREALLKGKEGSRRRQKWENDHLLGNPWAQPPLPHDWEVHPTHPVHNVPYFLAPLWDERQAQRYRSERGYKARHSSHASDEVAHVVKEVRQKLKRSKGAKGLLQDLEEEVRKFLLIWDERGHELEREGLADADSSEDDEIVFVGRNGATKDSITSRSRDKELRRDKLVFDSLVDDHGASFGRWLVHSIAIYYNLRTWSVTTKDTPARREAYVGIREPSTAVQLPRPLWGIV